MEVTSEYFSQRLDKNQSKKLTTRRKLGKSKTSKSNNSNQSKRRSSTLFKEFFRVDSPSKENVYQPTATSSCETIEESSMALSSPQNSKQIDEETESPNIDKIYLDDTLIVKKPKPVRPPKDNSNIFLDETLTPFNKVEDPKETKAVLKSEPPEDVRWRQLDELKRCPICLKKFDKLVSHVKSCATKHGITTDQLFKAIDLQLRQNEERAALGFLSSQIIKAPTTSRRTTSTSKGPKDGSLELALALSLSLQESKMNNLIQETDALMEMGLEKEALEQRKALEQFTLPETTSRTVPKSSKSISAGKRKLQSRLFLRSKEEREQILAEKVSIILMENDCHWESDLNSKKALKSRIHSKFQNKSKNLWQLSKEDIESTERFYVPHLCDSIVPCSEDIYTRLKSKVPVQEFDSPIKSDSYLEDIFKPEIRSKCATTSSKSKATSSNSPATAFNPNRRDAKKKSDCNCKFSPKQSKSSLLLKDLSNSWRHLLGNKMHSDLKIISKEEKEIAAHKVVFFARCPSVLDDLITETDPRTKSQSSLLAWSDYSSSSIHVFLEYLYCAEVNFSKLDNVNVKNEVQNLAERYDANSLIQYICEVESCSEDNSFNFNDVNPISCKTETPVNQNVIKSLSFEPSSSNCVRTPNYKKDNIQKESKDLGAEDSNDTLKFDANINRSLSPDIFSCSEDIAPVNNSILENHPDNLMHLVESIQKLNKQMSSEKIYNTHVNSSEEDPKKDDFDADLEIEVISSAEEDHGSRKRNPEDIEKPSSQENTDSTHYDGNLESLKPSEAKPLLDDDRKSSLSAFSRKRKSSISSDVGDKAKKSCLGNENILSVDLTQESSNSNSTQIFLGLDSVSDTCSPPGLNFIDNKPSSKQDSPEIVNCSASTISLPNNDFEPRKSEDGSQDESKLQLSQHGSPTTTTTGDELRDEGNGDTNHGYISPFWEAFDESCGIFSSAVKSPARLKGSKSLVNSPVTINYHGGSPKISSPKKIVPSSDSISTQSNKSSQDVVTLSPGNDSPARINAENSSSPVEQTDWRASTLSLSPPSFPVQSKSSLHSVSPVLSGALIKSKSRVGDDTSPLSKSQRQESENCADESSAQWSETGNFSAKNEDKSETQLSPLVSSTTGDEVQDGANEGTNYGYISPFWEAFDEGCGGFSAAVESPARWNDSRSIVNSSDAVDGTGNSPKTRSPEKIVLLSGSISTQSNKSSQDIITLSPRYHSPKRSSSTNSSPLVLESNSPSGLVTPVRSSLPSKRNENSLTPSKSRRQGSEKFANDSLFENESLLNQIEMNSVQQSQAQNILEEVIRTPSPQVQGSSDVTPMLDYSGMKTVQLKNELAKYGLKPTLGKKKGKLLLRHIYNELHPTVESMSLGESSSNTEETRQRQQAASSENHVSDTDSEEDESNEENQFECSFSSEASTVPEESFSEVALDILTQTSKGKYVKPAELEKFVREFIKSDRNMYKKVLMYEPLWLEKFQEDLKDKGANCKLNDLMDVMDKLCVTFRTLNSRKRNTKRSRRSKKFKRTYSQRVRSPRKGRRGTKVVEEVTYASD